MLPPDLIEGYIVALKMVIIKSVYLYDFTVAAESDVFSRLENVLLQCKFCGIC
jgi:hypothetical protein